MKSKHNKSKKKLEYTEREMIQYLYDENQLLKKRIKQLKSSIKYLDYLLNRKKTAFPDPSVDDDWNHNIGLHNDDGYSTDIHYDLDEPLHKMHSFEDD